MNGIPGSVERERSPDRTQPHFGFQKAVWILPCVWALHEAEEWNILAWFHMYWVNVPQVTEIELWTWLAFITFVGFAWTFLVILPSNPRAAALIVLPFFTVIAFGNALQHVYFVFKFGDYAPGVVTAVLLIIQSVLYLTRLALLDGLIPWWYASVIYLPVIPQLVLVIRSGNEVPPMIHALARFSASLSKLIFGSGG